MLGPRAFLSLFVAAVATCAFLDVHAFSSHVSGPRRICTVSLVTPTRYSFHDVRPYRYRSSADDFLKKLEIYTSSSSRLLAHNENVDNDDLFDGKRTATFVGAQGSLIGAAAVASLILGTPNFGLGPGIEFSQDVIQKGVLCTVPLGVLAYALDLIEDNVPAIQDVSKATQRSILSLLGGKFKPGIALLTSLSLGLAAGFGEEMLFRGVLQYELAARFGSLVGVGFSSIVFGALHAVTPLYAVLASVASVYFGWLYDSSGNLGVPIVTHALYDLVALFWAHWTVSQMTDSERDDIINWEGPDGNRGPMDGTIL